MDRIQGTDLWIGGYYVLETNNRQREAASKGMLEEEGITHILTVLRARIDLALFKGFEHLVIPADDVEDEDLLQHFPKTNEFISSALKDGGKVFVHCLMGVSRSATILAAYLMWSRQINAEQAVEIIQRSRAITLPNLGFMHQLRLYHQMGCITEPGEHPLYQRWLYQQDLELSRAAGRAPERVHFRDAERSATNIIRMGEDSTSSDISVAELRCKKCRLTLATSKFFAPHTPKVARPLDSQPCSHHFIEPLQWMKPELDLGKLEGKLECPKCSSKVGSYSWQGIKCSCGDWVVPGVSLARGKVDEVRVQTRL